MSNLYKTRKALNVLTLNEDEHMSNLDKILQESIVGRSTVDQPVLHVATSVDVSRVISAGL